MRIEPFEPFKLHPDPDGTQHAVKDGIGISVLPDVGEVKIKHRVGIHPSTGEKSRWLFIQAGDVKVFVNGRHIVITKRDLLPTFAD